jgi:cellulose synthase/poly-beta-1,6-N-acetylglucosamine synthase-like glycosyltransferase
MMRFVHMLRGTLAAAIGAVSVVLASCSVYLLALLAAGRRRRPRPVVTDGSELPRFVVLIPAHDEEQGLAAAVRALRDGRYPPDRRRIVVIADNCSDATAHVAREHGAEAWERFDAVHRGKGQALAWALERLEAGGTRFDAVAVVDADCLADPAFLSAAGARLAAGADAVQARYVVANPGESAVAALRSAAFILMSGVRFAGKDGLGLSCGLSGTGMAFRRELLQALPWTATSVREDAEYHLQLVSAGRRVAFAPETSVTSAMPATVEASRSQHARWESGNVELARRWVAPLLRDGLRRRDADAIHAALEILVPPQSLLAAGQAAALGAALMLRRPRIAAVAAAGLGGQAAFVVLGLLAERASPQVWRGFRAAPAVVADRIRLYASLARGDSPRDWVRTPR